MVYKVHIWWLIQIPFHQLLQKLSKGPFQYEMSSCQYRKSNQDSHIFKMIIPSTKKIFINSLWPSDMIWWQRSGSTLVQVMVCCLTASSHYLNQCWLIVSEILWQSPSTWYRPGFADSSDRYRYRYSAISHEINQPSIDNSWLPL